MGRHNFFESLDEQIGAHEMLLSDITGLLDIDRETTFIRLPELDVRHGGKGDTIAFRYRLRLGNPEEEGYAATICVMLLPDYDGPYEKEPSRWSPHMDTWVYGHGKKLSESHFERIDPMRASTFIDDKLALDVLKGYVIDYLGGPSHNPNNMIYDRYDSMSLGSFNTTYLSLMHDMYKRGMQMPKILSSDPRIGELIYMGRVHELEESLGDTIRGMTSKYDHRCISHSIKEMACIIERAEFNRKRLSPKIPLEEKFSGLRCHRVGELGAKGHRHNILCIDEVMDRDDSFALAVRDSLALDGRYNGSAVYSEFNLHDSTSMCMTGQIDMVVIDDRDPNFMEYLLGSGNTSMNFTLDNLKNILGEGGKESDDKIEQLKKEAKEAQMRNSWLEHISDWCSMVGVCMPAFYIVQYESELKEISKIISQKLNHGLR